MVKKTKDKEEKFSMGDTEGKKTFAFVFHFAQRPFH